MIIVLPQPQNFKIKNLDVITKYGYRYRGCMVGSNTGLESNADEGLILMVESWSRIVEGCGQRHRITAGACSLEAEGFV